MKNVVVVLALLLMGTTSAYAGNSQWTLCINGVDFKTGGYCGQPRQDWRPRHGHGHGHKNPGHGHGHNNPGHNVRPGFITLIGQQAYDVIRNGYIMSSRVAYDGNELYRVKYIGYDHRVRIYDCRVSPMGRADCQTWKH
jgi:hypothetical protein